MATDGFPKPVEDVVATLVDIYRHQGQSDIVEILESASARFELTDQDNWNGGTYTYALMLDIPVPLFASVESKLQEVEKGICSKVTTICRDLSNDHIGSVTITPLTSKSASIGPRPKPADAEVRHIWEDGVFRLFLSHVSAHKVAVAKLKSELQVRGISAFVAHEDITPSHEWQSEIELALRSMHALAALLTPDFHPSNWTDQEVGFALGKGVLVVPVRLGCDPYGFIGKVQGLSGSLDQPVRLASLLSAILLNHQLTHRYMRKGLVSAFAAAASYANAISLSKVISTVKDFAEDEKALIQSACKENDQVFDATGVVSRVCSAIGVPKPNKAAEADDVPF
jgi:TIR domain